MNGRAITNNVKPSNPIAIKRKQPDLLTIYPCFP